MSEASSAYHWLSLVRRLTVHISARGLTCQRAGEVDADQLRDEANSPAAEHFMCPGALHVFVRRHDLDTLHS